MKKRFVILAAILVCAAAISIGAVIALGTAKEPEITIKQYSLVLEDSVNIRYAVQFDNVDEENLQERGILVWETPQSEYTLDSYELAKDSQKDGGYVTEKITEKAGTRMVDDKECYLYDYTGIAAKQFTDNIYVVGFVVDKEGNEYYSELSKFSVLHYANAMGYDPDKAIDENDSFALLLQAMMEYGEEAQRFFDYGTDTLPTDKYYILKLEGGAYIKNDFSKIGLYKSGKTVTIVAPAANAEGKGFTGWEAKDKDGNPITIEKNADAYTLSVALDKDITYIAKYDDNVLAIDLKGGSFPDAQLSLKYPEDADKEMTIPDPQKQGYVFAGWYESDVLAVDSVPVTQITKNNTAGKILYARWDIVNETFDGSAGRLNCAGGKNGSTYDFAGGILKWYDAPNDESGENGDSFVQYGVNDDNGPFLWNRLDSSKKFTVGVKLALDGTNSVSPTDVKIGAGQKWSTIFKISESGEVTLGESSTKLAQLTTEFTAIYVTVDFKNMGMLTATAIAPDGKRTTLASLLEWNSTYDYPQDFCKEISRYVSFRASGAGKGYLHMDDVVLYGGDFEHPEAEKLGTEDIMKKIKDFAYTTSYEGVPDPSGSGDVGYYQNGVWREFAVDKKTIDVGTERESPFADTEKEKLALEKQKLELEEQELTLSARTKNNSPRLMLNSSTVENLVQAYNDKENARFRAYLFNMANTTIDGKLPAATYHESGRKGVHNYDGSILYTLEAKALMYQIALYEANQIGNEAEKAAAVKNAQHYGYEAIYGILNYLDTLNIQWIHSDRCREYGSVMYVAAEIYDWCYALICNDAATKEKIIRGVEEFVCTIDISGTYYATEVSTITKYPLSMEVGFPPSSSSGTVSGHSSEMQILRDYLAAAIAFYDEDPNWYYNIAHNVVTRYAAFRKEYYNTNLYPQGTGYASHRFAADLYSAWMMQAAIGTNPFENANGGMEKVMLSFASYERPDGYLFVTGDGDSKKTVSATNSFIAGALFKNPTLYTIGKQSITKGGTGANSLSVAQYLIFASNANDITLVEDTYAERDVILYNGSYVGQIISRSEWKNENAPASFMKIGERSTANHEHGDAGTFQIYYKGMLTGDSGVYASYSSDHWRYYYQATVAHNGLLVANPNKLVEGDYKYSGGQRRPDETATLGTWKDSTTYDTGKVTGYAFGYKDDANKNADFAYIAGNITAAYESTQASYVGRSMLTIYTDDAKTPMIFVTFDRITAADDTYESTYLLHAVKEPQIQGNIVTIDNDGGGRLVFESLTDVKIDSIGGEGMNYSVNGKQCDNNGSAGNDGNWGRVELSTEGKDVNFFNVMYVTDTTNPGSYAVSKLTAGGIEAAQIGEYVVAFVNSEAKNSGDVTLTASGAGALEYYLGGFAAGTWTVSVGGETFDVEVTEDSGLLHFKAAAGEVTITKKN